MSNKDTLLYLVSKLGSNSEGRKKIMKMMFLVNHFDVNKNSLVKTPFLNEDFIIYHYGVFSFKVMENFLDLSNEFAPQSPSQLYDNLSYPRKTSLSPKVFRTSSKVQLLILQRLLSFQFLHRCIFQARHQLSVGLSLHTYQNNYLFLLSLLSRFLSGVFVHKQHKELNQKGRNFFRLEFVLLKHQRQFLFVKVLQ